MRYVVAMLVLAVLALGAWFAFDRGELRSPNPESPRAPAAANANAQAATALPDAREEVPAATAGPGGDVLVVRFGSNEPVVGAEVLCMPPDLDTKSLAPDVLALANSDRDAYLRRVGPKLVSDTAGRCRLPIGGSGTYVVAALGELRAEGWVPRDAPQPRVLALRPDRTLHVRVVDAGGAPVAGVDVMLRETNPARQSEVGIGTTDARGCFVRPHAQELAAADATREFAVFAKFPGGECAPVTVEVTEPPTEVLLRLPAAGRVVVHVRDADGAPIDPALLGNGRVQLATWRERPANEQVESAGSVAGEVRIDARGDALFAAVAFDCFVKARVDTWLHSEVAPGPTLTEPQIELTARERAGDVVFTGVLIDADGQPLREREYQLLCNYANGGNGSTARTDAAGRFRLCLSDHPAGQRVTLVFDTGIVRNGDPMAAELPPRDATKGRNELGEVRLARHAVLAQGRVVAEPLPARMPNLSFQRKRGPVWDGEPNLWPEWKGASFTVRSGIPVGTPMRLTVQGDFLPIAPIEFAAGATDLEIALRRGGSVAATLFVDADTPVRQLRVRLARADENGKDAESATSQEPNRAGADGKTALVWPGLAPGKYRLIVQCAGAAEPTLVVDALDVGEGPCADPRLQAIQLRGRVRALAIRALTADGTALIARDAFVIARGGDHWFGYSLDSGVVTLGASAPLDVLVVAPGHRAAFVDGVFESRTIALESAAPTMFAVELPTPLPEGVRCALRLWPRSALPKEARLSLSTGWSGVGADKFFSEECSVGVDGRASVPVRLAATFTVELLVRAGDQSRSVAVQPGKLDLPAPGEHSLRVDAAAWQSALKAVGR
jgi:hypothetical protein